MLKRIPITTIVLSACFAALFAMALVLPQYVTGGLDVAAAALLGLAVFCAGCIVCPVARGILLKYVMPRTWKTFGNPRIVFIVGFVVLETALIISLLSCFPGICSNDSNDLIKLATGQPVRADWYRYDGLSSHHPVLYFACIWIAFAITSFLDSVPASVFAFLLVQVTFVAIVISAAAAWLDKKGAPRVYVVLVIVYFALNPILAANAIVMWKDIPFSAIILLLFLFLTSLKPDVALRPGKLACFGALLALVVFLRSNGVFVTFGVLLFVFAFYKAMRKQAAILGATVLVLLVLVNGVLFSALSIAPGHFAESVGIPIQQIAATVQSDADLPAEDEKFLANILPLDKWRSEYNPSTPNYIKFNPEFNDDFLDSHKLEFLVTWAKLSPAHFGTYAEAWLLETYSYWNPGFISYAGYNETYFQGQPTDKLGWGINPFMNAAALQDALPALFGVGSYIWITLAFMAACVAVRRGRRTCVAVAPFVPLLVLFATLLIAAPTLLDFRYVFALFLCIPFMPHLVYMNALAGQGDKTEPEHLVAPE